jgi:hypothetical protein
MQKGRNRKIEITWNVKEIDRTGLDCHYLIEAGSHQRFRGCDRTYSHAGFRRTLLRSKSPERTGAGHALP